MTILAIIGWVLTAAVTFMLGKGGIDKIVGTKEMVGNFEFMKLEKYRMLTGVGELLGILLLLIPFTSLLGMVLILCFMSAAVVMHLSMMGGAKTSAPIIIGVLAILSHILRTL